MTIGLLKMCVCDSPQNVTVLVHHPRSVCWFLAIVQCWFTLGGGSVSRFVHIR